MDERTLLDRTVKTRKTETKQADNRNTSGTDESSYYYSYGPFQSVNQEDTASQSCELVTSVKRVMC